MRRHRANRLFEVNRKLTNVQPGKHSLSQLHSYFLFTFCSAYTTCLLSSYYCVRGLDAGDARDRHHHRVSLRRRCRTTSYSLWKLLSVVRFKAASVVITIFISLNRHFFFNSVTNSRGNILQLKSILESSGSLAFSFKIKFKDKIQRSKGQVNLLLPLLLVLWLTLLPLNLSTVVLDET